MIDVFGGIDLNLPVGGINPGAVEYMAQSAPGIGKTWFARRLAQALHVITVTALVCLVVVIARHLLRGILD